MSQLSASIQETMDFIVEEWSTDETRRYACNFCGHPYGDADGGAIRGGDKTYPARCYESYNGRRCGGQILEVEAER
jgi:hypothetical protein